MDILMLYQNCLSVRIVVPSAVLVLVEQNYKVRYTLLRLVLITQLGARVLKLESSVHASWNWVQGDDIGHKNFYRSFRAREGPLKANWSCFRWDFAMFAPFWGHLTLFFFWQFWRYSVIFGLQQYVHFWTSWGNCVLHIKRCLAKSWRKKNRLQKTKIIMMKKGLL